MFICDVARGIKVEQDKEADIQNPVNDEKNCDAKQS